MYGVEVTVAHNLGVCVPHPVEETRVRIGLPRIVSLADYWRVRHRSCQVSDSLRVRAAAGVRIRTTMGHRLFVSDLEGDHDARVYRSVRTVLEPLVAEVGPPRAIRCEAYQLDALPLVVRGVQRGHRRVAVPNQLVAEAGLRPHVVPEPLPVGRPHREGPARRRGGEEGGVP